MKKKRASYALIALLLLQPALLCAAEKDSGSSFFKRNRKTKAEQTPAKNETPNAPTPTEAMKETTASDEENAKAVLPPAIPVEPDSIYLTKNSGPREPVSIPSPPAPIPGAPKSAPKPPTIPKTK